MMLAICSAPLQVRLHPVKSTVLILAEYLTLWQITVTKEEEQKSYKHAHLQYNPARCFRTMKEINAMNIHTL